MTQPPKTSYSDCDPPLRDPENIGRDLGERLAQLPGRGNVVELSCCVARLINRTERVIRHAAEQFLVDVAVDGRV